MRHPSAPAPDWHVRSIYVRHRDGPRRLEQAFRLLLGPARPPQAATFTDGRTDHANSHLCPRLDRPPGARPDD